MHIGPVEASGVVVHEGMGSGVVFSSLLKGSLTRLETLDMWLEVRGDGRVERGWRFESCSIALFMCELGSRFEFQNSAISSWVFSISLASTH